MYIYVYLSTQKNGGTGQFEQLLSFDDCCLYFYRKWTFASQTYESSLWFIFFLRLAISLDFVRAPVVATTEY
jgi:hypothetical protein